MLPRFAILLPLLYLVYYLADTYVLPRSYIFDPKKLQELSQGAIKAHEGNATLIMQKLVKDLQAEYGTHRINSLEDEKWFFNNAGGCMGSMVILHASITEYLILFGTPIGTEGHSGLHPAHDYFTILTGQQKSLEPGMIEPAIYNPGDQNHMRRGVTNQYGLNGWALELAQGWIPAMLPFGFLDTFTSTLDFPNLWVTVHRTAVNMIGQLLTGKF